MYNFLCNSITWKSFFSYICSYRFCFVIFYDLFSGLLDGTIHIQHLMAAECEWYVEEMYSFIPCSLDKLQGYMGLVSIYEKYHWSCTQWVFYSWHKQLKEPLNPPSTHSCLHHTMFLLISIICKGVQNVRGQLMPISRSTSKYSHILPSTTSCFMKTSRPSPA